MSEARISVRVQPRASRTGLAGRRDGVWSIKVAAPPEKGKANVELIRLLTELLNISKKDIAVVRGVTASNKVVAVSGMAGAEVEERLLRALQGR